MVSAISDASGDVAQFVILSCDGAFRPELALADKTVRLNSATLAAESKDVPVTVYTQTLLTGGSAPAQIVDLSINDSNYYPRGYALGVNDWCEAGVAELEHASGSPEQLPAVDRDYRNSHPPNFYAQSNREITEDDLAVLVPDTRGIPQRYVSGFG